MINSIAKMGHWFGPTLTPNGTAVVVVNVTRRTPPVDCPVSGAGMSPGGPPRYGAVFAKSRAAGLGIALQ